MNHEGYRGCSQKILGIAAGIEDAKRPAYTMGDEDVLNNFKVIAMLLGITPRQVLMVFKLKHTLSLCSWAKSSSIPQAEPLDGRFADDINYNKLGYGMYCEDLETLNRIEAKINEKTAAGLGPMGLAGTGCPECAPQGKIAGGDHVQNDGKVQVGSAS